MSNHISYDYLSTGNIGSSEPISRDHQRERVTYRTNRHFVRHYCRVEDYLKTGGYYCGHPSRPHRVNASTGHHGLRIRHVVVMVRDGLIEVRLLARCYRVDEIFEMTYRYKFNIWRDLGISQHLEQLICWHRASLLDCTGILDGWLTEGRA